MRVTTMALAGLVLATGLCAQDGGKGIDAEAQVNRAVQLYQQIEKVQANVLTVLEGELWRIENEAEPDKRTHDVHTEVRAMRRQIMDMEGQVTVLMGMLQASDPDEWPMTLRERLESLGTDIRARRRRIDQKISNLARAVPRFPDQPEPPPLEDEPLPPPPPIPGLDPPGPRPPPSPAAPDSMQEASRVVGAGRLKDLEDVVVVFERASPGRTPTGSLRRWVERARGY